MVDDLFDIAGASEGDEHPELVLRLHVQPGAGRTAVVGRHGDSLKVKVAAPPTEGRANDACLRLVAELAGVPAGQVTLRGGASSRSKRVGISGVDAADLRRALERAVTAGNAGAGPGVRPGAH